MFQALASTCSFWPALMLQSVTQWSCDAIYQVTVKNTTTTCYHLGTLRTMPFHHQPRQTPGMPRRISVSVVAGCLSSWSELHLVLCHYDAV